MISEITDDELQKAVEESRKMLVVPHVAITANDGGTMWVSVTYLARMLLSARQQIATLTEQLKAAEIPEDIMDIIVVALEEGQNFATPKRNAKLHRALDFLKQHESRKQG
jgi:hypothetical protein